MAKLGDANPRATRISLTMVPGTDAYMPPEAVTKQPIYTAKIDCFAIGALIVQILTRQFPDPGNRLKTIQTIDPQFPTIQVPASEIERRQNHISQVDPNHPLLPIALHCLKDSDVERPSAQELCHTVAALKETPQYTESVMSAQERRPEQDNTTEREEQIRELQQQIQQKDDIIQEKDEVIQVKAQQIQGLQQIIGSQNNCLQEKDDVIQMKDDVIQDQEQTISAKQQECQQLRETIKDKDRELQRLTQQLQTSKQVTAQFQTRIQQLEKQQLKTKSPAEVLAKPHPSLRDPPQTRYSDTRVTRDRFKLTWKKGNNAPCKMNRVSDAVVDGEMVYFRPDGTRSIYTYNSTYDTWNKVPDPPVKRFSIAVISNLLTTIGGQDDKFPDINQLFSLIGKGSTKRWKEVFPPMPTKRYSPAVVCKGQALIVAGGGGVRTVEVMDISTRQWSTAADIPERLSSASATICGDRFFMLGGNSVYTCSLADLFLSNQPKSLGKRLAQSLSLSGQARSTVWNKVADLPVTQSTCVTLHGRLLAIGGLNKEPASNIHIYNATSNQWEIISKMTVARYWCFAAVLPSNQLMLVGGCINTKGTKTDSVEIATIV